MMDGNYPDYSEPKISFFPSYKMAFTEGLYIEKKNQSPSYTDRVLFKNNSNLEVSE